METASRQQKQMNELDASIKEGLSKPEIDLATRRDIAEGVHLAAKEPEGVTYAEVDVGGALALWCIPKGCDPHCVRRRRDAVFGCRSTVSNPEGCSIIKTAPVQNKALVLQAFDTLFNKRDYKAAERYWSSNYIQHSAHIPPGRDGLFNLVRSTPASLKYEPGLIAAENDYVNDYVIVHGRFPGTGRPRNWVAADVVRVADGMLAEHWDVLQDEATKAELRSGLPMFGTTFPE